MIAAALFLFAAANLSGGYPEYSHVYSLIRYKLAFLGRKPLDPTAIPFDARILWSPPFNSPGLPYLVTQVGVFLFWGAAALVVGGIASLRGRVPPLTPPVFYFLLAFGTLFALIQRVSSFLVFYLALAVPVLLGAPGRSRRPIVLVLLLLSLCWQAWQIGAGSSAPAVRFARTLIDLNDRSGPPNYGNNRRLIEWIRTATRRDAVFLTWYPTGPMVLLDGERPIVLHSKFESSTIREKYRRLLEGLYGDEEVMARVCEEYDVDYFLSQIGFTLDRSNDSELYRIGLTALPTRSTAFRMHFSPETLRRFTLVYQDSFYRVFRFHPEGEQPELDRLLPYEEVWQATLPPIDAEVMDERYALEAIGHLERRSALSHRSQVAYATGDLAAARASLRELFEISPDAEEGLLLLSRIERSEGYHERALATVEKGLATRPESAELWFEKGEVLREMGKPVRAGRAYLATLERNPDHRGARALLGASRLGANG
jgi:tetratricopeptide (TPR) repeat protein